MSWAGIGIGSNRQGYILWAFCPLLSSSIPLTDPTVSVRRLHYLIDRHDACGEWPLDTVSRHPLDDAHTFEYFYHSLILFSVPVSLSSIGLRVVYLYHYCRARLIITAYVWKSLSSVVQLCSARPGHVPLVIVGLQWRLSFHLFLLCMRKLTTKTGFGNKGWQN
jgi:hypothetical protein